MKQKLLRLFSMSIVPSLVVGFFAGGVANAISGVASAPAIVSTVGNLNTDVFCPIIDTMFYVLISISVIMVLWAAYLYAIAQEDTEKTSTARRILLYASVGIVVALIAKGFPSIIMSLFNSGNYSNTGCP